MQNILDCVDFKVHLFCDRSCIAHSKIPGENLNYQQSQKQQNTNEKKLWWNPNYFTSEKQNLLFD